jgi:hypothetical protein
MEKAGVEAWGLSRALSFATVREFWVGVALLGLVAVMSK